MVTKRSDLVPIATIHNQGNQFAVLNKDGTVRHLMNHSPCAPAVGNIDLIGLCAEAALNTFRPCPGLEVRDPDRFVALCGPDKDSGCAAIVDLPVMVAGLDLRREVFFDHPLVAPELLICAVAPGTQHQEAAPGEMHRAEFKKMVPWDNTADKANKADVAAADPRAIKMQDLILNKKIDLTAYAPNKPRAAIAEAKETMAAIETQYRVTGDLFLSSVIPAARGATAYYFCQAAVPFQVMEQ